MKSFVRTALIGALITLSSVAQADWSANLGIASEYCYRGIFQESTSANSGLDFESGGFHAGTWAADVGDGLEVDGYFGYGFDVGDVCPSLIRLNIELVNSNIGVIILPSACVKHGPMRKEPANWRYR